MIISFRDQQTLQGNDTDVTFYLLHQIILTILIHDTIPGKWQPSDQQIKRF